MKTGLILQSFLLPASRCCGNDNAERPRDIQFINEDNCHFFGSRGPEQMTSEGLQAWVDQYADEAVTHLSLLELDAGQLSMQVARCDLGSREWKRAAGPLATPATSSSSGSNSA